MSLLKDISDVNMATSLRQCISFSKKYLVRSDVDSAKIALTGENLEPGSKNRKGDIMLKKMFLLLSLVGFFLAAGAPNAIAQASPLQDFDNYVEEAMRDWMVPGLAISVVKDDSLVLARGYGVKKLGNPAEVDAHTLFAIASNSKAFTATAIGMLIEEGKLSWDDPAIQYLPTLLLYDPYVTREITIRDLLCHRSGFQRWGGDMIWYGSDRSVSEVLFQVRYLTPHSSFRSKYGYCNLMFVAAGQITEAVSGKRWGDFLAERIFEPLGMRRTRTSTNDLKGMENVASPHTKVDGKIQPIPYRNIDNSPAAGAINSSAFELAQWLRLQLSYGSYNGEQVVDSTIIKEMRTPHTIVRFSREQKELFPTRHFLTYGLGLFLSDYHGRLLVTHGGGLDGMFSYSGFLPEEKLGIAVLTNLDDHRMMTALFHRIVDAYLDVPKQDWSAVFLSKRQEEKEREAKEKKEREGKRSKKKTVYAAPKNIAGSYKNQILGDAEIIGENRKLILTLERYPGILGRLEHWDYETYICKWNDPMWGESDLIFVPDGQGSVGAFRVKVREDFIDPLDYVFERVED